jgi:hypothetical protein
LLIRDDQESFLFDVSTIPHRAIDFTAHGDHTRPDSKRRANEEQYRAEHDPEDGLWVKAECVMCGESTRLRDGGCHTLVCHQHESCPNGCDDD